MDHLNKKPITIYGDGKQKSEYIFIDDVVMSFYLSLKTKKRFGTEVIHVGRGKNNSVVDIIDALEKAWGIKFKKKFVKMRPGEHKIQIKLNPKPLKKYLNYSLRWNLVEGLKKLFHIIYNSIKFQKVKKNNPLVLRMDDVGASSKKFNVYSKSRIVIFYF